MITHEGKELVAKFLLGQAPAYATHIALGCGARPAQDVTRIVTARGVNDNIASLTSAGHGYRIGDLVDINISASTYNGTYKIIDVTKDTFSYELEHNNNSVVATSGTARLSMGHMRTMDFEMIRIPISSRGYVNENGITKIAFAAEIPTTERFLISEAALWSAGSNSNAVSTDSRMIYTFGRLEGWRHHYGNTVQDVPWQAFLAETPPDIDSAKVGPVFMTANDTPVMTNAARANRYEPARFMSQSIFLRGNSSKIDSTDQNSRTGLLSVNDSYANNHVHLDTVAVDLSKNNPDDELKLAFSVVSRVAENPVTPAKTRIMVEFMHSESDQTRGYARMFGEFRADDIDKSRYCILTKRLRDLVVSPDFDWTKVRVVRIYASCYDAAGALDGEHYVALDGMRFDNVSSPNPTYAMTGYSVYNDGSTSSPKPIYKVANTSNYIEFRANLGVI